MIEFLSFIIFIIVFVFVLIYSAKLSIDRFKLKRINLQLLIEKKELSKRLEKSLLEQIENDLPKTDAFLNFISDSREWAYQYIDEAQLALSKFITDIEPEINYFDEYGVVGSAYPHYHSMKKISGAYKELKKLLPEDYDESYSKEKS